MNFPHPVSLSAALFTIGCALILANCKSLSPLVFTAAVLINKNNFIPVMIAAVFFNVVNRKNMKNSFYYQKIINIKNGIFYQQYALFLCIFMNLDQQKDVYIVMCF